MTDCGHGPDDLCTCWWWPDGDPPAEGLKPADDLRPPPLCDFCGTNWATCTCGED